MTRVLLAVAIVASMLPTAASFSFFPQPFSGSARGLIGHNSRLLMSPVPRLMSGQAGDNGGNSADMQVCTKALVRLYSGSIKALTAEAITVEIMPICRHRLV